MFRAGVKHPVFFLVFFYILKPKLNVTINTIPRNQVYVDSNLGDLTVTGALSCVLSQILVIIITLLSESELHIIKTFSLNRKKPKALHKKDCNRKEGAGCPPRPRGFPSLSVGRMRSLTWGSASILRVVAVVAPGAGVTGRLAARARGRRGHVARFASGSSQPIRAPRLTLRVS